MRLRSLMLAMAGASACLAAPATAERRDRPRRATTSACVSDAGVRARADALIARMTVAEKAGQLTQRFALPFNVKQIDQAVTGGNVGALLFVSDPKETNRLQRLALDTSRLKIPLLFGFDVVHGFRTIFPVPIGYAASWDPAMVERISAIAAAEARAAGVSWTFSPMIDVTRDPRWGRIVEGPGEDPFLASVMAAAQVRGFQGPCLGSPGRVIAGAKHFAGYGAAAGGRDYDEASIGDADLHNIYLPPFKAAVDAGAGNIMAAYMALNGVPASANRFLLQDVLRDRWGFKGFVVSDADAVKNLVTHGVAADPGEAARKALDAGIDMEMAIAVPAFDRLPDQLAAGTVSPARLDEAVRRILEAKIRMGLFEHPYVDEAAAAKLLGSPAHRVAARQAAERSAVLLRNEGNLLPLDQKAVKSLAVIGPLADSEVDTAGPAVFEQQMPRAITVASGLRALLGAGVRVDVIKGVSLPSRLNPSPFDMATGGSAKPPVGDEAAEIARAVAAARSADIAVLVLGEGQNMIGEQGSRSTLELPGRQRELLDAVVATGKPVVLLLMSARPLTIADTKAAAILDLWYPGSEGGAAAANLLFGRAAPAGRLPFTWPRDVGQVPLFYAHLKSHEPRNANNRYWNAPGSPAFPFGYGLSYSTFTYANPQVDRAAISPDDQVTISVDLTNTGARVADEVAQLYLGQRTGSAARPVRELKGFQRVTLRPGERRTLSFVLRPEDRRYWSAERQDWVQDAAEFDVAVGRDSSAGFGTSFKVMRTATPLATSQHE
ncbi:beta-glucosidase BglX [Sphingomonas sp.]|uniref:beta-glucosidase BglX n=1 Tax=Sphingomonas sp. TaxID=28214 RepID=UPI0035BC3A97